ncbi:hypothetical protein JHK82_017402 [Glycine max]|nr:hypothetical protein JHK85_017842 [Glycine max]KAG5036616.1 hypothetical protein JHK86_017456 [Glycine max]KAG5141707.1 hypothetical protein JHK82_017402 [Glycine max]
MILMDREGDKIIVVKNVDYEKWQDELKEGSCYIMENFEVNANRVFFVFLQIPRDRSNLIRLLGVFQTLHAYGSSGCVGCYKRPTLSATVDVPSKGLATQGNGVRKPSSSEDFWTTSTHDMDNSAVQSQGSISSASLTNQAVVLHAGSSKSSTNPTEFVNHGVILWNQTRQRWVGNKKLENRTQQLREPKLNWNATYESLLGSNKPFHQPIPLAEMVDFLVDIWEQDGLYD